MRELLTLGGVFVADDTESRGATRDRLLAAAHEAPSQESPANNAPPRRNSGARPSLPQSPGTVAVGGVLGAYIRLSERAAGITEAFRVDLGQSPLDA